MGSTTLWRHSFTELWHTEREYTYLRQAVNANPTPQERNCTGNGNGIGLFVNRTIMNSNLPLSLQRKMYNNQRILPVETGRRHKFGILQKGKLRWAQRRMEIKLLSIAWRQEVSIIDFETERLKICPLMTIKEKQWTWGGHIHRADNSLADHQGNIIATRECLKSGPM